jgi:hypothetical protein
MSPIKREGLLPVCLLASWPDFERFERDPMNRGNSPTEIANWLPLQAFCQTREQ